MPDKRFLDIDSDRIAAVFHRPDEQPRGTVIFCHGFATDKEGRTGRRCEQAVELGFQAVRFDFRGNNESSREFQDATLSTRVEDLQRVLDEVEETGVGVYGSSFGGLVALHTAAKDDRIDGLALRAPVTYLNVMDDIRGAIQENGVYEHIPGKKVGEQFLNDLDTYSTDAIIENITVPTLLLQGTDDEAVPMTSTKRFYQQLGCEKDYFEFTGQGHRFDDEADTNAVDTALDWFQQHFNR